MKIGIIDSGKGALAIGSSLKLLNHDLLIIMDECYFPYGNKSKEFLCKRALYLCDLLIKRNVDIIILACNTLSLYALDFIKSILSIKIIGIFDFIKDEMKLNNLFIGTTLSCKMIKEKYDIDVLDGSEWICHIQNKYCIDDMINNISKYKEKYTKIILGCTHFLVVDDIKCQNNIVEPTKRLIEAIKKEEL